MRCLSKPTDYVTDRAGVLKFQEMIALDGRLAQFERETSDQVLVYIDRDLPPDMTIEDFSKAAMRQWQIGQTGKDNGVVLFVFTNARQMRLQVGAGLQSSLTDAKAHEILGSVMKPRLQNGDFAGAVNDGAAAVLNTIRGEPFRGTGKTVAQRSATVRRSRVSTPVIMVLAAIGAIGLWIVERFFGIGFGRRRRYDYYDDQMTDTSSSSSSADSSSSSSSSFEGGGASGDSSGTSDSW